MNEAPAHMAHLRARDSLPPSAGWLWRGFFSGRGDGAKGHSRRSIFAFSFPYRALIR